MKSKNHYNELEVKRRWKARKIYTIPKLDPKYVSIGTFVIIDHGMYVPTIGTISSFDKNGAYIKGADGRLYWISNVINVRIEVQERDTNIATKMRSRYKRPRRKAIRLDKGYIDEFQLRLSFVVKSQNYH